MSTIISFCLQRFSDVKQEFQVAEIEETELNLEREISKNFNARQANENDGNKLQSASNHL